MIKPIDWENTRSIVELGAGTGVFTRYVHELKHPHCKAVIFERDRDGSLAFLKWTAYCPDCLLQFYPGQFVFRFWRV